MEQTYDMLGAVELAMEAERTARDLYSRGAETAEHPSGRELFLQLVVFEQNHFDYLKKLHQSLSGDGQYIKYDGTSPEPSGSEAAGKDEEESRKDEVLEILNTAIEAEREAQNRYAELARQTTDPWGQQMFQKLAAEEGIHLRILNDEYFNIANQGSWSSKNLWSE